MTISSNPLPFGSGRRDRGIVEILRQKGGICTNRDLMIGLKLEKDHQVYNARDRLLSLGVLTKETDGTGTQILRLDESKLVVAPVETKPRLPSEPAPRGIYEANVLSVLSDGKYHEAKEIRQKISVGKNFNRLMNRLVKAGTVVKKGDAYALYETGSKSSTANSTTNVKTIIQYRAGQEVTHVLDRDDVFYFVHLKPRMIDERNSRLQEAVARLSESLGVSLPEAAE
jgi:hypothetical protein